MTDLSRGLDMALSGLAAGAWGLAAFVVGSRLLSPEAGGVLGLAVAFSGLAFVLSSHLKERLLERLLGGTCPSCGRPIELEHQHRHWDPKASRWIDPSTSWDCGDCGFSHGEAWDCPTCTQRVD